LFHVKFFYWIGQGIVKTRPERPPLKHPQDPGILVLPHVSLQTEVPENDGWKEILHPAVSQHRDWPKLSLSAPPPIKPIVQATPDHSLVQSSHSSKRLRIEAFHAVDKEKSTIGPSSPSNGSDKSVSSQMHLRDDCSHMINEIRLKGSVHPKENLGKSIGDNNNEGRVASKLGNMVFKFYFNPFLMTIDFKKFWTRCFILDI
jgi:hypothetical protein